ncbi:oligosaccharide flippase family protein [Sphingomonas aurea]|uniref:oligosaccharide flippase family protein n=1 Tax=Sphingomonas aurea TaxID=3063994 RepID=UPI0027305857|nr:oligosaccharide flippase family protein [Sphingomonas sp. KR1UV-12]
MTGPSWQKVKRGLFADTSLVIWAMIVQNLLRIVSSMTLTRLLTAEAFAVMAVITSVLVTIGLVSDIGISAFIVRHEQSAEREFRDEVWTLRLIRGVMLSVATAALSIPFSNLMGRPELYLVIAVAGLTSVLDGLGSLAPFVALRSRRLRRLTAIDVGSQIIGLVMSITLAVWLRSYWAMILANLVGQALGVVFSYIFYEDSYQRWRFSRERAAELWRFSRFITGSTILTLIITQGDKLILTRALPLHTLGLYVIAAGLAAVPASLIGAYASKVTYPLLAEVRREAPETMAYQFYHHRLAPALCYAFAAGGLIGFGPTLIAVLYDPRYLGAGAFLQILAISSFFTMGTCMANEVMIALGHARFTFFTNVVRLTYLLVGGAVGWFALGPIGIVWAVGTVELVAQLFGWFTLRRHALLDLRWEGLILILAVAGVGTGCLITMLAHLAFPVA